MPLLSSGSGSSLCAAMCKRCAAVHLVNAQHEGGAVLQIPTCCIPWCLFYLHVKLSDLCNSQIKRRFLRNRFGASAMSPGFVLLVPGSYPARTSCVRLPSFVRQVFQTIRNVLHERAHDPEYSRTRNGIRSRIGNN